MTNTATSATITYIVPAAEWELIVAFENGVEFVKRFDHKTKAAIYAMRKFDLAVEDIRLAK